MSIWTLNEKKRCINKLSSDIEVDTLIIGGGITGLSCAYFLRNLDNIYFHTDHVFASENQSGYNSSKDLSKSINVQWISEGAGDSLKHMLTPTYTHKRIEKDINKLTDKGVKGVAADGLKVGR